MTIKIEREALLCVLSRPPRHQPGEPYDEFVDATCSKEDDVASGPCVYLGKVQGDDSLRSLRIPTVEKCESFDDDCTVTTASSSAASSLYDDKRVSFADPLVTEVFTRPRTPREEISKLFYSCEETQRFRQDYRLERKLLAELDVDPETHPVDEEELSALFSSSLQTSGRHRISRVVVLHNDKLETFLNPDAEVPVESNKAPEGDDFFDNDSFWSGSITWY
jgi:hypothetical protein